MKSIIQITCLALFVCFSSANSLQAQTPYLDYLYNSSPSLQASRNLAGEVNGWFQDMDNAVQEYKRKYPNGNPEAEARGRAYLMGLQGAYQAQEDASHKRRSKQLKRLYTDVYNKAKIWKDYYWSVGNYKAYNHMQSIMETYDPDQFD